MTENFPDLERFVRAQDAAGTYASALAELRAGPSAGTGCGSCSRRSPASAAARRPSGMPCPGSPRHAPTCATRSSDLGCASAPRPLTPSRPSDAVHVLGTVDAVKLRSSMTLFERAASDSVEADPFARVLEHFFEGRRDDATTGILGS